MSAAGEEKGAGFLNRVGSLFRRGQEEIPINDEQLAIIARLQEAEAARMQVEEEQQNARLAFPLPQCHLAMGVTSGARRTVLTAADLREKAPQAMAVEFVQVVDPMVVEELIKERELTYGIDLKENIITADRAMAANLEKTIPRLHRELDSAYGRKREYASKRVHWEWAEADRTLKKTKGSDPQQVAVDKAYAEKRKLEVEMQKLQDRMRKAAEDEQRLRQAAR